MYRQALAMTQSCWESGTPMSRQSSTTWPGCSLSRESTKPPETLYRQVLAMKQKLLGIEH